MHKLYKQSGNDLTDISNFCADIKKRSTKREVSEELNFKVVGDDVYKLNETLKEGDIIVLKSNNKVYFKGVVVTLDISGRKDKTVKCFDFGYYLNKNEAIYQFDSSVSENIKKILKDFDIKIGNIVEIPTLFKKVTRGTLTNIIDKMLNFAEKEQGKRYIWEMKEDAFMLQELTDKIITYTNDKIKEAENINKYISRPTRKVSIEGLYNAIKVAGESENKVNDLAYKEDSANIAKYGKMQRLEYLDKGDYGKATNIANNQLKLLNKVQDTITCTLLGNDECRANRILQIEEPVTGITGKYLIISCTHRINNVYLMDLELEVI